MVVTDSKNLEEAIKLTSLVDDLVVIKEAVEKGTITKVKMIEEMTCLPTVKPSQGHQGRTF